jgi:hypothetical protein
LGVDRVSGFLLGDKDRLGFLGSRGLGGWRVLGSFAALRVTARTNNGRSRSLRDDKQKDRQKQQQQQKQQQGQGAKGNSKDKYRGLSTAAAKCAAYGRDDVVFGWVVG